MVLGGKSKTPSKPLKVETSNNNNEGNNYNNYSYTPKTEASTPGANRYIGPATPQGIRGHADLRSPGISKTPVAGSVAGSAAAAAANNSQNEIADDQGPLPDFMTQTDKYGNAITPRNNNHNNATGSGSGSAAYIPESSTDETEKEESEQVDACDTLLESLRMMCCCILPEPAHVQNVQKEVQPPLKSPTVHSHSHSLSLPTKQIVKEDVDVPHNIKLLPSILRGDPCHGKKCLVLDLDETLVHSSFRAVPGADFVIPVQIEDVVHFVYVIKRPGVDEFLIEMAKHYEIVIYTASLNKYADPLLDLLDPHNTIRFRLFRESCVYYEGSYVKDLSLVNRDLTQTIIIDNSPASYLFHPENAIDCSSFIDDPADRELHQIGSFLSGVKNVDDVRGVMNMWRQWPRIPRIQHVEYPAFYDEDEREVSEPLQV